MTYKHIKIGMDFSSEPVWVRVDNKRFFNGYLGDLSDLISESLFNELELYAQLWDKIHWWEHKNHQKTQIVDFIAWEKSLAKSLSQELPGDYSVYYYDLSLQKNVMVD